MTGFNLKSRKYVSTWIDSMGTGVHYSEGDAVEKDGTLTITFIGKDEDGTDNKSVLTIASDGNHSYESFSPSAKGGWWLKMRIQYTRQA